jgi:hypothetical protein
MKNLHVNGLCGRCLSESLDWGYSQSCWYFRPSFVKCFPSNFLSGSSLHPSPSLSWLNQYIHLYIVYVYVVTGGEGASDKHLPQSTFAVFGVLNKFGR